MPDRIKIYLRRIPLKRTIFGLATIILVFLIVSVFLVVRPVRTVKAHRGCSDRTLMGNYGWSEFGYEPEDVPPDFWTTTALVNFDGHGKLAGSNAWLVDNAAFFSPTSAAYEGTYAVNADCTVTINYTLGAHSYIDRGVIVGVEGSEILGVEQGYETTGHVDIKKIIEPE
jgi:hypothetical protein